MMNLNSSKIIIFGANGLLGSKVSQGILEAGGELIAVDRNIDGFLSKVDSKYHNKVTCETLDITSETCVDKFFCRLDQKVSGAVNCTYPRNKTYGAHFFDVKLKSFNENLALHLGSAFLISQQCARYFENNRNPFSLVNISSVYGVIAPKFEIYKNTKMTMPVEYAATKSAIIHLNQYISAYVSNSKFRVNSVSPGGIFDEQPKEFCIAYKKHTNGAGMLDVSEMVGSIIFLLSDASRYITGQNIIVDDGFVM